MVQRPHLLLPVLALVAAAGACQTSTQTAATGVEHLRALEVTTGGERRLSELDVNHDGRIDPTDWKMIDAVLATMREELASRGGSIDVHDGHYHGPAKTPAPLFDLLDPTKPRLGLTPLPTTTLWELVIETRWLELQARAAMLVSPQVMTETFGGALASRVPGYNADSMRPSDLCHAVDAIDTKPFEDLGLKVTAVTDLDSTVWKGNVMDVFLAVLVDEGLPLPEANPELIAFLKGLEGVDAAAIEKQSTVENARLLLDRWRDPGLPPAARPTAKDTFYQVVQLLRGLSVDAVHAAARDAFEKGALGYPAWSTQVYSDPDGCGMRELIGRMEARGIEMYFLSATLDVLAEEAARVLGIPPERALGSLLEVRDGRYTGRVRDSTYYTKGTIVRQWLAAPPLLAFGDSVNSDFSMLSEASGAGFMINPHAAFIERDAREARSRLVAVSYRDIEASGSRVP